MIFLLTIFDGNFEDEIFFVHFSFVIKSAINKISGIKAYLKPKSLPSSIIGVDNILLYLVICYHSIITTDISLNGIISV